MEGELFYASLQEAANLSAYFKSKGTTDMMN